MAESTPRTPLNEAQAEAARVLLAALRTMHDAHLEEVRQTAVEATMATLSDSALRDAIRASVSGAAIEEVRRATYEATRAAIDSYRELIRTTQPAVSRDLIESMYKSLGFWGGAGAANDIFGGVVLGDLQELLSRLRTQMATFSSRSLRVGTGSIEGGDVALESLRRQLSAS